MQVIAGSAKGTKLSSVPGDLTRPILDRVKTSLFDILRPRISGITVLDLFAGTGAVGIEALSQGAASCVFIDLQHDAIKTIKHNLEQTELTGRAEVKHTDAFTFLRHCKRSFDLIYIAPPQFKGIWIEAMRAVAEKPHLVAKDGLVVVQIDPSEDEELNLTSLERCDQRKYGKTLLSFWSVVNQS